MNNGTLSIIIGIIFIIIAVIFIAMSPKYSYLGIALIVVSILVIVTGYMRKNK